MKIYSRNDAAARRVLAEVKRLAQDDRRGRNHIGEDYVTVEVYANCREQGFALKAHDDCKVAFSECRNTDQIVVYVGKSREFEFNTNIPSERAYSNARFFNPDQVEHAAKFIFKTLSK